MTFVRPCPCSAATHHPASVRNNNAKQTPRFMPMPAEDTNRCSICKLQSSFLSNLTCQICNSPAYRRDIGQPVQCVQCAKIRKIRSRQKPAKEDKDSLGCAKGWSRDYM